MAPRHFVSLLGEVEVLLLTSRDTGWWIIPKGWPMKGKKPYQAAEIEALEEAGVRSEISRTPFSFYSYAKEMPTGADRLLVVDVHLLACCPRA